MGTEQYHEPANELSEKVRTFARMITSLIEEAEAIGWYEQRISLEKDSVARAIMKNAQQEEFKHFGMDLEYLLRNKPRWRVAMQDILFKDGDIVEHGEEAEEDEDSVSELVGGTNRGGRNRMYGRTARFCGAVGIGVLIIPLLVACGDTATPTPTGTPTPLKVSFDFRDGAQGWGAGFADYPPGSEQGYELDSGIRALPAGIEPAGTGFYITGNNHSDDLYMFLKRELGTAEGVQPNTTYQLTFKIVFASDAPSGCLGIGGAPGEGVTLKTGASDIEPMAVEQNGLYKMNVDKGEQTTGGPAGAVVGDIGNGLPCDQTQGEAATYASVTKEHTSEFPVESSASGDLWLLVGTDSGFEGPTSMYYQQIEVELDAVQ